MLEYHRQENPQMSLIVVLRNVSKLAPVSDYEYQVLIGDGSPDSRLMETGKVFNHVRANGWDQLIRLFVSHRVPSAEKDTSSS